MVCCVGWSFSWLPPEKCCSNWYLVQANHVRHCVQCNPVSHFILSPLIWSCINISVSREINRIIIIVISTIVIIYILPLSDWWVSGRNDISTQLNVGRNPKLSSIWTVETFVIFLFCINAFTCVATQGCSYIYVCSLLLWNMTYEKWIFGPTMFYRIAYIFHCSFSSRLTQFFRITPLWVQV